MNTVTGDAVELVSRTGGCLAHQVNTLHVAGGGIALAIRQRWPEWWRWFYNYDGQLGDLFMFSAGSQSNVWIANLYAQNTIGRKGQHTNYAALDSTLISLSRIEPQTVGGTIYIPYGIGCGLGGGDWNVVLPMLEMHVPWATLVRLPTKE